MRKWRRRGLLCRHTRTNIRVLESPTLYLPSDTLIMGNWVGQVHRLIKCWTWGKGDTHTDTTKTVFTFLYNAIIPPQMHLWFVLLRIDISLLIVHCIVCVSYFAMFYLFFIFFPGPAMYLRVWLCFTLMTTLFAIKPKVKHCNGCTFFF